MSALTDKLNVVPLKYQKVCILEAGNTDTKVYLAKQICKNIQEDTKKENLGRWTRSIRH